MSEESALQQANIIKSFCDWRKFEELEITQFADYIFIRPKKGTIDKLMEYWNIYQS